jgi:hypothetical protein
VLLSRARNIKPGFFENDSLAECSAYARLLFIGLWTLADRRGILEYRPKRIAAAIFPYERLDIEKLLTELSEGDFIQRYEANSVRGILIPTFCKHQNPHQNEKPSDVPAPEQYESTPVQVREQYQSDPAESLLLNHESGNMKEESKTSSPEYPPDFLAFWNAYPPGSGSKLKSFQYWRKVKAEHDAIMVGVAEWHESERWVKGYVKACEIWLRDRLWENPPPPMIVVYPEHIRIRQDRWDAESIETGVNPKDRPYPPPLLEAMAEYRESLRNGRKNGAAS